MVIKNCSVIIVTIRIKTNQPTDRLSSLTCYVVFLSHLQLEEYKYKYFQNMNLSFISFN
jgi:hypothetical protein